MMAKARLGRIAYLNVLPIYFALEHIFGENGFHLVRGTPAELNALMRRGEVDLGSISALEYGRAFRDYLLLPDLSISSRGAVGSVLLFSRVPFSRLDGRTIRVSAASASGAALVKVLMAKLFEVQPRYQPGPLAGVPLAEAAAVMAIGDEALRLKAAGAMPFELDLGAGLAGTHRPALRLWGLGRAPGLCRNPARSHRRPAPAAAPLPGLGPGVFAGVEPHRRALLQHDPGPDPGLFPPAQLLPGPGTRGRPGDLLPLFV